MKFMIETSELQRVVNALSVSAKLNTTDVSGRVLIYTNEDGLNFLVASMYTTISVVSKTAKVEEKGTVAVLYSTLRSFVNSVLPWDGSTGVKHFLFEEKEHNVTVNILNTFKDGTKSKGNIKLPTFQAYTIPIPQPFVKPTFILNSSMIKTATNKVIYAIDPNDSRTNIQGMNISFSKDHISFAGTNGFMLSEYKIDNISELTEGKFTVNYNFVMGLRRLVTDEDQLFFELSKNTIIVKFGNICYWGRLVIGQEYPEYSQEFEKFLHTATINKEVFMSCLRPLIDSLVSEDNNRLRLHLDNKTLIFKNDTAEFVYEGVVDSAEDFQIDINGKYMLNTISAITDEDLVMKFSNESGCLIFDSEHHKDQKALITPIQFRA